jgi:ADP-heptose:LPS heptosyltransferase
MPETPIAPEDTRPGGPLPVGPQRAPEAVLVLRFSSLGDVVLTAPAVEALHNAWPTTRILFAVKAELAPLVRNSPFVHEVLPLERSDGVRSLAARAREVGAVLDLHGKVRSQLLRLLLRKPSVVWHKRDFADTVAVKLLRRPYHAKMRIADRYHAAVEALVGRPLPRGRLRYFLGPDEAERAARVLREAGVEPSRPRVALFPGATRNTKQWPVERFGELARRILGSGFQVVVGGSAAEAGLCREVVSLAPGAADVSGRFALDVLGGFLAGSAAFVGNDSGPMHVARALGVPTLAFFGPTDPGQFDFTGCALLFAGVPCSPCSFFGQHACPRGHFRCMADLDVERAWQVLSPLLSSGRRVDVGG